MKHFLLVLAVVLAACTGGTRACQAAPLPTEPSALGTGLPIGRPLMSPGQPRVAIETEAAITLAQAFITANKEGFPSKETFCLLGWAPSDSVILIRSAFRAYGPCETPPGIPADSTFKLIGIAGFVSDTAYEARTVITVLAKTLLKRPDLLLLGEIHGISRVHDDEGWHLVPLMWGATRAYVRP